MKQIGILGGTFDPPHIGHLLIAEIVRDTLDLDKVLFIPTNEPPHKEKALSPSKDRVNMLHVALQDNDHFVIETIELERTGKSYSIDTIRALTKRHPDARFYFIIGADMVEYLPKWFAIDKLIQLVTFVGVKRVGYHLESKYPIKTVDVPLIDISSSAIRKRIGEQKTVKYFLPDSVLAYIKERNLYGS